MGNTHITFLVTLGYPHSDIQHTPFSSISPDIPRLFPAQTGIDRIVILLFLSSEAKFRGHCHTQPSPCTKLV